MEYLGFLGEELGRVYWRVGLEQGSVDLEGLLVFALVLKLLGSFEGKVGGGLGSGRIGIAHILIIILVFLVFRNMLYQIIN